MPDRLCARPCRSSGGPCDSRRIDAGAQGRPAVIGESNADSEGAACGGLAHDDGIDAVEHELGSPEHVKGAGVIDIAPREVNEAVAQSSLDRPSAEVELSARVDQGVDVEFPARLDGIASREVLG